MSDEGFDPDDIDELEGLFTEIVSDNEDGFVMEFIISVLAAKELIDLWEQAELGDYDAQQASWQEYTKIIMKLENAVYGVDE
jgi:hypothetical protein